MNILFVGTVPFPSGSAGAARVRTVARALHAAGNKVFVLSLVPDASGSTPAASFEEDRGLFYRHVPALPLPAFLKKQRTAASYRNILSGVWFGKQAAREIILQEKIEKVVFYSWSALEVEPILGLAREMGLETFADVVEYPSADYFRGGEWNPLYRNTRRLLTQTYLKLDGIISITSYIADIYQKHGLPTLKVPALVEPDFYAGISPVSRGAGDTPLTITYVGSLAAKDDPLLMLDAFELVLQKQPDAALVMVGSIAQSDLAAKFMEKVKKTGLLQERVRFKGRVSDADLKGWLLSSDLLLLPRFRKPGVMAAFPTRLPELLLSGKPCVTTDVGDMKEYLQDGIHARLAVPGDAQDLAQKILSLMEDKNFAAQIGSAGKECAQTCFNYHSYAQPLSSFLNSGR